MNSPKEVQLAMYRRAMNRIDDFLEYQWRGMHGREIRNHVLSIIDDLTISLHEYYTNREKKK